MSSKTRCKIVCIIQARMGSGRLPGKVLKPLGNKTVLGNVIHRIHKCKLIDGVVVATTTNPTDKPIIHEAINNGAQYFAGSEHNVLERYYKAAKFFGVDRIVRVTADCPLIMPDVVDKLIHESSTYEYGSNVISRTYPKGFDCEVFSMDSLEWAVQLSTTEYQKEHVTPYIKEHAINSYSLRDAVDNSSYRITIDTEEDYNKLTSIYKGLLDVYNYKEAKQYLSTGSATGFFTGNYV